MKKKKILYLVLSILLLATGFVIFKIVSKPEPKPVVIEEIFNENLPPADASILVDLTKNPAKANSVILSVKGLDGKYKGIGYEFTYDSKDISKGVNSGNIPVDISGKSDFSKEVYLGTCSRNVCTPDPGVTSVSVVLVFTDNDDKQSQFSKDFDL